MLNIVHYFGVKKLIFGRQQNRGDTTTSKLFFNGLRANNKKREFAVCEWRYTQKLTEFQFVQIVSLSLSTNEIIILARAHSSKSHTIRNKGRVGGGGGGWNGGRIIKTRNKVFIFPFHSLSLVPILLAGKIMCRLETTLDTMSSGTNLIMTDLTPSV